MEININPMKKQTVSDDPELAKVLAGVNAQNQTQTKDDSEEEQEELQYENLGEITIEEEPSVEEPMISNPTPEVVDVPVSEPVMEQNFPAQTISGSSLDNIKIHALTDLRPLVDKLTVSSEEKFDIYLLLLRSSDDNTLIEPAYNAARLIEDETKRANALLDVIKEIDYFNSKK